MSKALVCITGINRLKFVPRNSGSQTEVRDTNFQR